MKIKLIRHSESCIRIIIGHIGNRKCVQIRTRGFYSEHVIHETEIIDHITVFTVAFKEILHRHRLIENIFRLRKDISIHEFIKSPVFPKQTIHAAKDQIAAFTDKHHFDTISFSLKRCLQYLRLDRMYRSTLRFHDRLEMRYNSVPTDIYIMQVQSVIRRIILSPCEFLRLELSPEKSECIGIRTGKIRGNYCRIHSA